MRSASDAQQRGGSKVEFLLLVAVIGVLAFELLDRLSGVEVEAERTEVNFTLRNIRVGLRLAVGERLMRGQEDSLGELLDVNPVSLLGHLPRGYLGETSTPGGAGSWRFDPATRELSYRPRQPEAFGGKAELRWQMKSQGALGGRIVGIRLENKLD